jgi:hypothetical protein
MIVPDRTTPTTGTVPAVSADIDGKGVGCYLLLGSPTTLPTKAGSVTLLKHIIP